MTLRPLVVVGDALLDRDVVGDVERLAPDAPVPVVDERRVSARPGGAGLAALLARSAHPPRAVTLVTALGHDPAGAELRDLLEATGVEVVDLGIDGRTPEKVRVGTAGRPLLRLDRGARGARVGVCTAAARAAIGWAAAVLVADYGRGVAAEPGVREALAARPADVPLVWDPHPRGPAPVAGATLVTPNAGEAAAFAAAVEGQGAGAVSDRAAVLRERWAAQGVCVTRGAQGAVLVGGDGTAQAFPADAAPGGDPCGAGDRFASRAAELLADGASAAEAVAGAVAAATAFVAAGGAASVEVRLDRPAGAHAPVGADPAAGPDVPVASTKGRGAGTPGTGLPLPGAALAASSGLEPDVAGTVARVRAAGGAVVATGGCFDLLHTGHVRTLEAARALGDCLVVLLNSDASVRRLKGPGRPVVRDEDRAAVLRALRCVDAVLIFDEDTPTAALERLRPDVWAKGGDYAVEDLPEASALAGWGGRVVLLPYLDGRSTTKLIEEAALRVV